MSVTSYSKSTALILSAPYTNFSSIEPVCSDDSAKPIVSSLEKRYVLAGVTGAFEKLRIVPQLVELAYAGCKSSSSQTSVLQLQSGCLTLGFDTQVTCLAFVDGCFDSLKKHKLALMMLSKKHPDKAFLCLKKTGEMAGKMASKADVLVTKSKEMCTLAEAALAATSDDNVAAAKKHQENREKLAELEARKEELKSETSSLKTHVAEAKEQESKAAAEVDVARTRAFTIAIVQAVMEPINAMSRAATGNSAGASSATGVGVATTILIEKKSALAKAKNAMQAETDEEKKKLLEGEIAVYVAEIDAMEQINKQNAAAAAQSQDSLGLESAAQREAAHHEERVRLQEQERKAAADLAGTVVRLKSASDENDHLATAKASLELAIKAIGRITTVFETMRAYWLTAKAHCDQLSDVSDMELVQDFEEEFVQAITDSWFNWLVLGRITFNGAESMKSVIEENCRVMRDIPTSQEARERLPSLIARAQLEMKLESDKMEKVTAP